MQPVEGPFAPSVTPWLRKSVIAPGKPLRSGSVAKPVRKYRNIPTEVDGITFASRREANRWSQLRLMEKAKVIRDLKRQVEYRLEVNGQLICKYRADFTYFDTTAGPGGSWVTEDAKGFETPEFKLKAKLMLACHGIEVRLS